MQSTDMLQEPDPAEVLDEKLSAAIREIGIPPCPAILNRVVAEMRNSEPDFRALASAIGTDVALSAALLKTVNSPFFGYRSKARTVHDALMMLGLDLAASTVASIVLRRIVPAGPQLERFWDASARVAQLCCWLVQQLGANDGVRAEDAYTYGLFRDCGIPILMRKLPGYAETLRLANDEPLRSFTEVEDERHPTNHAVVGALMAQSWWLPENTAAAIRHHHSLSSLAAGAIGVPPAAQRLVALGQLAELYMQRLTGLNHTREWDKLGEACAQVLRLAPERVESLEEGARALLESCPPQP